MTASAPLTAEYVCAQHPAHSPFRPWSEDWLRVPGVTRNLACWYYADCVFKQHSEVGKQQVAATALLMGLIPLLMKDIAWPHRRIAYISQPLPWFTELLVRGLGLDPVVPESQPEYGRKFSRATGRAIRVALAVTVLASYGLLAVMELHSKRSALGCPYPVFIMTWFVAAFLPAGIEVLARRIWRPRTNGKGSGHVATGIQGAQELWWIQASWAVYYAAGTLIFTSIMAVTVLELFVWVVVCGVTTAASKMFAYSLCGYWSTGPGGSA